MSARRRLVMTRAPRRAPQSLTRRRSSGSGPTPATTSRSPPSTPTNLRPLLERLRTATRTSTSCCSRIDETVYSREIAPLAGFYPSVFIGAPWWFLDAPDAILRFRAAVTETAGFYRGVRASSTTPAPSCSIPARHDMARRLDSAFLARLVREGRITLGAAERIAVDLVDALPRRVVQAVSDTTESPRRAAAASLRRA